MWTQDTRNRNRNGGTRAGAEEKQQSKRQQKQQRTAPTPAPVPVPVSVFSGKHFLQEIQESLPAAPLGQRMIRDARDSGTVGVGITETVHRISKHTEPPIRAGLAHFILESQQVVIAHMG